jgi:hypothetical protein
LLPVAFNLVGRVRSFRRARSNRRVLRVRIFAIACGYEDADDLDRLRSDPAFKLACGRLPDTGVDLCSQPTVSRWENTPFLARSHPPDGGYG